jgi:hypothetical protein
MAEIIHTPDDNPAMLNLSRLDTVAIGLRELLFHLEQSLPEVDTRVTSTSIEHTS